MVSVPVLSKTAVSTEAMASSAPPCRKMTCRRAARSIPPITATGAARISGHGVATTSTASTRPGSPDSAHATAQAARVSGVNQVA